MAFSKFSSIENAQNMKNIKRFKDFHPEICDKDMKFIIFEKIDGSNFQLIFEKNKDYNIASRNQLRDREEGFSGSSSVLVLPQFQNLIVQIQNFVDNTDSIDSFNLYGEIFGKSVINRIDYGDKTKILFYASKVNGNYSTPEQFLIFMKTFKSLELVCPHGFINSLDNALDIDVEVESQIVTLAGKRRIQEGIIILPFNKNFYLPSGQRFIIKKKSKNFCDKAGEKNKEAKKLNELTIRLNDIFKTYINKNRMLDMFSKEGRKIQEMKEIGFWIKLIIADAKEEFHKDYAEDLIKIESKERKFIYSCEKIISNLLIEELKNANS